MLHLFAQRSRSLLAWTGVVLKSVEELQNGRDTVARLANDLVLLVDKSTALTSQRLAEISDKADNEFTMAVTSTLAVFNRVVELLCC